MREIAKVLKVEKHTIEVQTFSNDVASCQSCPLNTVCGSKKNIHVINPNGYDIKVGDMVEINIPQRVSVSALSGLLYGIPVVILLSTLLTLKYFVGMNDYISLGIAGGIIGLYYLVLNKGTRRRAAKFSPSVVKKVNNVTIKT
ncbi:SoxR reducing system RseC family protein [Mesoaciditoga lauensis]|uniref:SoxR reducing system RseC family protein n=1 Tax=Mesoaciditoga lauensis TaxID=1495039 RepID=UPI00056B363A|nr:SoxR reducing system RseC family protein [Mesoaciditoga lauensis]